MRCSQALVLLPLFVLISTSTPVFADSPVPGKRFRISYLDYHRSRQITGDIVRVETSVVTIRSEGDSATTSIERRDINRVERHVGTRSHWAMGMGIGCAAGLVVGVIAAAAEENSSSIVGDDATLFAGMVLGAGLGTLVGAAIRTDQWESVPLSDLRVGLVPGDARGIKLSWNLRL